MLRSNMRALAAAAAPPAVAAVIGNAFVGRDSLRWFRKLRRPRMQLPLPAFLVVGLVYYASLARFSTGPSRLEDRGVRNRTLQVTAGNEL
jgi:tryptophan-rich sensory protein